MREKLREAMVGGAILRLFKESGAYKGAVIVGKSVKVLEGSDADDVWRRLHDEAGKANPKYFGFDGARNRFLHFFPNGLRAHACPAQDLNYKVAANTNLDDTVPVEQAKSGSGFGEAIL